MGALQIISFIKKHPKGRPAGSVGYGEALSRMCLSFVPIFWAESTFRQKKSFLRGMAKLYHRKLDGDELVQWIEFVTSNIELERKAAGEKELPCRKIFEDYFIEVAIFDDYFDLEEK